MESDATSSVMAADGLMRNTPAPSRSQNPKHQPPSFAVCPVTEISVAVPESSVTVNVPL